MSLLHSWVSRSALIFNLLGSYSVVLWSYEIADNSNLTNFSNFNASNFRIFMWKCFYSFDHFLPVKTPLQYVPQPFVEASAWMIIWASHCWIFLPLQISSFPSTKTAPPWLNFPVSYDQCRTHFSVELIFVPVENIKTGLVLVKRPRCLMTADQLTLRDLRSWDLSCIGNRPVLEGISENADLPFWNSNRE